VAQAPVADVLADGRIGDHQAPGYSRVGAAFGDEGRLPVIPGWFSSVPGWVLLRVADHSGDVLVIGAGHGGALWRAAGAEGI
jgi:hypothetical protein